ncbi:MAG: glycosyltransferase [Gammaproteobacteria bacterium]|nr:MAG: glycosyltransferase [Gammaproteobacteria bacterium]
MIESFQILGSRGGGGAERFYVRFTKALHALGHPVHVVTPGDSWAAAQLADLERHPVPMRNVFDLFSRLAISRLVGRHKPCIVQTWMGRATRLTHIPRNKGIVHLARLGGYYDLKGYVHAHAWIGNTRGICDYLIESGLPRERVFHIGNFVDIPPPDRDFDRAGFLRSQGIPGEAFVLLGVGRLHPNKGFDVLLRAFERLPARVGSRPVHLVIVGSGPLAERLHAFSAHMDCRERIHWMGWKDDVGDYYRSADVFVCPSNHEPLGNVILEAWAQGLPVVSTSTDGARELVAHAEDGLLVPVGDPKALADAITLLLRDDTARVSLANRGFHKVSHQYGRDSIMNAYIEVYGRLLAAAR